MPRNRTSLHELGSIDAHGTDFRAHIQFRNDSGELKHIHGPSRATENEAQKDLDQIRAAGGVGATRAEGLKLWKPKPAALKYRLKIKVKYTPPP